MPWIAGKELLSRWGALPWQLWKAVKNGLQPHDSFGKPMPPPGVEFHLRALETYLGWAMQSNGPIAPRLRNELKKCNDFLDQFPDRPTWKNYEWPDDNESESSDDVESFRIMRVLLSAQYNLDDVLKIEVQDKGKNVASPSVDPVFENAFISQRLGWDVWYQGIKTEITGGIGVIYITNLIQKAGEYIHVTDLCNAVSARENPMLTENDLSNSLKTETMSISTMQDEGLDPKGKEIMREKIRELKAIIDEPDSLKSERKDASEELEQINRTLKLYGKNPLHSQTPKKPSEGVKRSLDSVKKAIDRVYEEIGDHPPGLVQYLEKNILRGSTYRFTDTVTPWHIAL